MSEYAVTVTYYVAHDSADEAEGYVQRLLDGHMAEVDYVEEVE